MEEAINSKWKKLLLFGGNRKNEDGPLFNLAVQAINFIDEVIIFTEEEHLNLSTQNGQSLLEKLQGTKNENLKWIKVEQIDSSLVRKYIDKNTIGLLTNARWILKQNIIDLFDGRLFNYHNARLPQERGAAAYSWKILTQGRDSALTIHKVLARLDAGDIIKQKKLDFPEKCRTSADYYNRIGKLETKFLVDFLKGKELICIQQNESDSIYMPRLSTLENGYINWDWSAKEIELFICAFDDPHQGASTFFQEKRLHLKKCFLTEEKNFHPFQAGIIYRKINGKLFVAAKGGGLEISEIFDENGKNVLSDIKIGQRFQTPHSFLDQSKASKIRTI